MNESNAGAVASTDGLGLEPERSTVRLTLADLGVLAQTAERNGTAHAFPAVALQWAAGAQAEIERLRAGLKNFIGADIKWQDDLDAAVAAERERCAAIAESWATDETATTCANVAAAIRGPNV